ncbi:hypothetical protein BH11VER1_BH11VER1_26080 [soil metagenome]
MSELISIDWAFWGTWALTGTLLVLGLIGTVVPLLPGPVLIFIAGIVHTLLRPESGMSWWAIAIQALLVAVAYGIDIMSGAMGTKWFGGSKWGVAGVLIGGIVGLFFGLIGLIFGPIIGGFAFEMIFARKQITPAAKATWGTLVGTGVGLVARLCIGLVMIAWFFANVFWL